MNTYWPTHREMIKRIAEREQRIAVAERVLQYERDTLNMLHDLLAEVEARETTDLPVGVWETDKEGA